MRIFDHANLTGGFTCPICGNGEDRPVTLIGIDGTEEGNIMEAAQVHVDCLELRINKQQKIIYQIYRKD